LKRSGYKEKPRTMGLTMLDQIVTASGPDPLRQHSFDACVIARPGP
jgi:hypothetical protein